MCSNFPTNQSIHLLHWSLKRRPKSSRTRGCDSGRSSTSTISPSGLRSRSWQLTTGSRYVEARYTTVNICVVTSIGREPVKGLREDVVEDDRFWEGAVVGVIYYCFDYFESKSPSISPSGSKRGHGIRSWECRIGEYSCCPCCKCCRWTETQFAPTAIACSRSGRA